jgi:hypothetical protein
MISFRVVQPKEAEQVWPEVRKFIVAALKVSDWGHAPFQILELIKSGGLHLAVIEEAGRHLAAAVIQITRYDTFSRCRVQLCGGEEMDLWIEHIRSIEDFARGQGCDAARIVGRRGWARVLDGWKETGVVLDKRLDDETFS